MGPSHGGPDAFDPGCHLGVGGRGVVQPSNFRSLRDGGLSGTIEVGQTRSLEVVVAAFLLAESNSVSRWDGVKQWALRRLKSFLAAVEVVGPHGP